MLGDADDMASRLWRVLPNNWFNQTSPLLNGVLTGLGTGWAAVYALISAVRGVARIATSTGAFLDSAAYDFFGTALLRWPNETDAAYLTRVQQEMLRPRGTRAAVVLALSELTGKMPIIFEPALTSDTGGYTLGGVGYGAAGGYGSLMLPFQAFITAFRPVGCGIAQIAGYDTGGYLAYGNLPALQIDSQIFATVEATTPIGTVAWTRISN
jgi:hypothetical protein